MLDPTGAPSTTQPRPLSPMSNRSANQTSLKDNESPSPRDAIDYQATVNALTVQFLSEHEETRVAALRWLIMLHQKVPRKV
jgi:vacuole morphology and inheritance protein 14